MDKQIKFELPLQDCQLIGAALIESDQSYKEVNRLLVYLTSAVNEQTKDPKPKKKKVVSKPSKKVK